MKKLPYLLMLLAALLCGCAAQPSGDIAATTLPVYQFTTRLTAGTPLTVTRLVTENVSCLHDYTLTVDQMKAIESARVVVLSGAGLEDFLEEALLSAGTVIDSSAGIPLLDGGHHHHHVGEDHEEEDHLQEGVRHRDRYPDQEVHLRLLRRSRRL